MESTSSNQPDLTVETFLDVPGVERQLNELWMQNAGAAESGEEGAMLRARVLNLMVYMTDDDAMHKIDDILMDVAMVHPCRALVMIAESEGEDKDIEMNVASRCQLARGAGGQHLCCEEVTLRATGRFTVELPSTSVPLLVSDLPVFLWWHATTNFEDPVFQNLLRVSDRIIIDTALSQNPITAMQGLARLLLEQRKERQGLSDLSWARLTSWRTLLASFYDSPEHHEPLSRLNKLRIDYVSPDPAGSVLAPKAMLLTGWLASRLGWQASTTEKKTSTDNAKTVFAEKDGKVIAIELVSSKHSAVKPGGLVRVELVSDSETHKTFVAMRAEDCRDFETVEASSATTLMNRVVSSADKSESQLLAAELEILSHDRIYEEAVVKAVELFC